MEPGPSPSPVEPSPTPPPLPPLFDVIVRSARWILPAWLLLPLTAAMPRFDLTGRAAWSAWALAESGGQRGMPWAVAALTALVVTRPGVSLRRALEALAILLALTFGLGAMAWANEHSLKPALGVFRPDILELSERGALGLSPAGFYALPDKPERSRYLARVLASRSALPLHPRIRAHWVEETGFSFPSGHSTAAMTAATFFTLLAMTFLSGRRRALALFVVPWAVLVCASRPFLRVHSALDVSFGGLQGVALGLLSYLVVRRLLEVERARATGPTS